MNGVVIVSGGMDSVTLAYYLKYNREEIEDWHYLSFNYGQRHNKEVDYAAYHAHRLDARHDIVDLRSLTHLIARGSVLVTAGTEIPEGHYAAESMKQTVVPNRNSIMLSIAVGVAVAEEAEFVAAGMHAGDHFIYPDCRPMFIEAFNIAEEYGNEGFWEGHIEAPFVEITKTDIVRIGTDLGIDYRHTWSCYQGRQFHCGKCGTCVERQEAFQEAGVADPTTYEPDLEEQHE